MLFSNFLHDERGAVTVDWVVLTAAVAGIGLAVMGALAFNTGQSVNAIFTTIDNNDFDDTSDVLAGWGL